MNILWLCDLIVLPAAFFVYAGAVVWANWHLISCKHRLHNPRPEHGQFKDNEENAEDLKKCGWS